MIELYPTDYIIIQKDNTPLRFISGQIGLWSQEAVNNLEIDLRNEEQFLSSDKIAEPYRTELIKQLQR